MVSSTLSPRHHNLQLTDQRESLLHPHLLQPHNNRTLESLEERLQRERLERADREQADELVKGIARRMASAERPPAEHQPELLERSARFLGELLIDERLDAGTIADAKQLHDDVMTAVGKKPCASVVRAQGVETEASRRVGYQKERRHTRTTVQVLPMAAWVGSKRCLAAATVYYVTRRPRTHEYERFFYADVEEALAAHPRAKLLDPLPTRPAQVMKAGNA